MATWKTPLTLQPRDRGTPHAGLGPQLRGQCSALLVTEEPLLRQLPVWQVGPRGRLVRVSGLQPTSTTLAWGKMPLSPLATS